MSDTGRRFSVDYAEARERFREATREHEAGTIDLGDDLGIDWAWVGPADAARVLLYTSGLHGIEGFGGGAAQLETLELGSDVATMYVHGLNPYGWRHLRRVNENNVDLNRNFLLDGQQYAGAPAAYARLDGLLNPATAPGGIDLFWLHAAWAMATQGYGAMRNAIVSGQYEFDRGLFFGGKQMEAGPRAVAKLLVERLSCRERVVHVDWHSALGQYGDRTVLLESSVDASAAARVRRVMGEGVRTWDANDASAYAIRGGMTAFLQAKLPGVRYDGLTCEFGTQPNLQVLAGLRAENRLHHWGTAHPDHPAKAAMRAAFAPREARWEAAVLGHAREMHVLCHALIDA
ncbi:MAG: DUF2817 domain-containing protein [Deltaproteobacteria bacterium]|nr:DUF2817 domain-containing protein [Deltaproteobacteria bacterium]